MIDVDSKDPFLPGHRKRMTLTAKGIQFIAERFPTLLPELSEADIRDKSKAALSRNQLFAYRLAGSSCNA